MSEEQGKEVRQPEDVKKTEKLLRGGHSPHIGKKIQKGEVRNPTGKNGQNFITNVLKAVFQDEKFITAEVRKIMKGKSAMAKVMLIEHAAERLEGKVAQPVKVSGELTVSLADEIRKARDRAERIKDK